MFESNHTGTTSHPLKIRKLLGDLKKSANIFFVRKNIYLGSSRFDPPVSPYQCSTVLVRERERERRFVAVIRWVGGHKKRGEASTDYLTGVLCQVQ